MENDLQRRGSLSKYQILVIVIKHANTCRNAAGQFTCCLRFMETQCLKCPHKSSIRTKCKPNKSKFCFHQVFLIQWSLWEPLFLYWHGKNSQTLIYNVASQHERNYIPWNFLMQPAVRACVQSSKRAETTKGSRDCNITEFFKKWHGKGYCIISREPKFSSKRRKLWRNLS